jgi:hypothetical protein
MKFVYLLVNGSNSDWEDMAIFLTEHEAIQISIKYPNARIEIFSKYPNHGYLPTYNYYENGKLYEYSDK